MSQKKNEHLGYSSGTVDEPSHRGNVELLAYWEQHRLPGGPLLRAEFEPLDIPKLLPGIFIAEPRGDDFRFRLAGSDVEGRMHRAITGLTLTDVFGAEAGPPTIDVYRYTALGCAPFTLVGHYQGDNLEHVKFEVMHLPLQFKNGNLGVLGGQFAFD